MGKNRLRLDKSHNVENGTAHGWPGTASGNNDTANAVAQELTSLHRHKTRLCAAFGVIVREIADAHLLCCKL
ncbi:hypothetical protein [Anaplasma platys]|uniref:hypothetical protein n=1 Tax=Anaplasma platys TaxID=949 RepID=UPI001F2BACAB|nr:hypothetical protein [Anaplasma platys]